MFFLRNNDKYDSLIEKILYIDYFIHQFVFVFSASYFSRNIEAVNKISNLLIIFTFLIIILADAYYFFRGKFSVGEIKVYCICSALLLISFLHYRVVMVLLNIFAISCFKNVDYKKILKIYLLATIAGIICNILISIFTPYVLNETTSRYGAMRVRYGLGFFWVTFSAHYFYSIVFIYILFKEKLKYIDYIVIMIVNIALFILTDTKAVFLYTMLLLIIEYIFSRHYNEKLYKVFGIFTSISFIFFATASYFLSALFDEKIAFFKFANRLLSGRLTLMHRGLEKWGFTIWGQTIPINESGINIDSSMVSMLMQNGLIVYLLCITFMTIFSYMAYKTKKIPLLIALFAIAIRSAFDLGFMALQFGPVVILFYVVMDKYKNDKLRLNSIKA